MRTRIKHRRQNVAGVLLLTYSVFLLLFFFVQYFFAHLLYDDTIRVLRPATFHKSRQLLQVINDTFDETANCTPPGIEQFPKPLMSQYVRSHGGVILHIFVSLYVFLALAVVCDEYFVPSLEKISDALKLKPDVAGATFMAAGSSAPELATAIIAVFLTKDDIGVGTVVGSAVYNIAFVVSVCGLFAGRIIYLSWWPLFRDCLFYLASVIALMLIMWDKKIDWIESLILLVLYFFYIVTMFLNERMESFFTSLPSMKCMEPKIPKETVSLMAYKCIPGDSESESPYTSGESSVMNDLSSSVLDMPPSGWKRALWFVSFPILLLCYLTVPDCRDPKWQKWYTVGFVNSCVWIGAFSYVLVWMITIIGFTLNIPDTVMGLTFLAAGVSVPDAIASLIVAKEGLGDMAISNAVGSNVFDILVCLGLPWFLQTAIISPASTVPVYSDGLVYTSLSLLTTVLFLLVVTHLNGWKLDRKYGAIMMAWYLLFMLFATLYQLNIFGNFTLPSCPSEF